MFNVLFSPKRLMRKSSFSQRKDRLSCGYQAFLDRREALKDCEEGYRSDLNENYSKYSSSSEYYSDYSASSSDSTGICQQRNGAKLNRMASLLIIHMQNGSTATMTRILLFQVTGSDDDEAFVEAESAF